MGKKAKRYNFTLWRGVYKMHTVDNGPLMVAVGKPVAYQVMAHLKNKTEKEAIKMYNFYCYHEDKVLVNNDTKQVVMKQEQHTIEPQWFMGE